MGGGARDACILPAQSLMASPRRLTHAIRSRKVWDLGRELVLVARARLVLVELAEDVNDQLVAEVLS